MPTPSWRILSFMNELSGLSTKQIIIKVTQVIMGRYVRFKGWIFDRRHGIETSEMVEHPGNLVGDKIVVGEPYVPVPPGAVHQTMKELAGCIFAHGTTQQHPGFADFCLYDFGSGKGRILIIALEYMFKQVIGIEYSRSLNDIARKNMDIYQTSHPKMPPVRLFLCDAANFSSFEGGNKVFFFYNPFSSDIIDIVLRNLRDYVHGEPTFPIVYAVFAPDYGRGFEVFLRNGFKLKKALRWTDCRGWRRELLFLHLEPPVSDELPRAAELAAAVETSRESAGG